MGERNKFADDLSDDDYDWAWDCENFAYSEQPIDVRSLKLAAINIDSRTDIESKIISAQGQSASAAAYLSVDTVSFVCGITFIVVAIGAILCFSCKEKLDGIKIFVNKHKNTEYECIDDCIAVRLTHCIEFTVQMQSKYICNVIVDGMD